MKPAYFAGGCFWCIADPFYDIEGVRDVVSGFSGGDEINPTYEEVKKQLTNHRETIAIYYDETKVSYKSLLDVFLRHIDPFDDGGQFIDRGHSYTTAIYFNDEEELKLATEAIKVIEDTYKMKSSIALEKAKPFYEAEEYHQKFSKKNKELFEKELEESGRKTTK